MTDAAVIQATFADFKIIKGRKQTQLVFEIPIEQADDALRIMGGLPRSDAERWFAIARLEPKAAAATPKEASEKPRQQFGTMPLPQQIALRCGDKGFWSFLRHNAQAVNSSDEAAGYVRQYCGVKSRSEIQPGTQAAEKWKRLDDQYYFFQRGE